MIDTPKPHAFLLGPTAIGKSDIAVDFCESLQGEIINSDSLQVYQGLSIGTALPTENDFDRVPHLLFSYVPMGLQINAGDYRAKALEVLKAQKQRGTGFSLFCGGSGFYIKALDHGMFKLPDYNKNQAIENIDGVNFDELRKTLKEVDPETFNTSLDPYRTKRALEVYYGTGKPLSFYKKTFVPDPPSKKIILWSSKNDLLERVKARTQKMLTGGLIEEYETAKGKVGLNWAPLNSIGYAEVTTYFEESLSLKELEDLIIKNTMKLIKRQLTWFKKVPNAEIIEYDRSKSSKEIVFEALKKILVN